ncbi:MAG: hypothetical protein H8E36_00025, partial [Rhodospirillaceae bacterium]|nr:hypothetical protein [Rhodospirillaceae bacterium]
MNISVEISPGELIDKITILEIKLERIEDEAKLANVRIEYDTLTKARDGAISPSEDLSALAQKLKAVNEALWEIEDDIRDQERARDFGDTFVALARAVYVTNDERMAVKREINDFL